LISKIERLIGKQMHRHVLFEELTAANMKSTICWNVTLSLLIAFDSLLA
jgi:hypothetical protein